VLLVVDVEKFSAHSDSEMRDVYQAIREILDDALKSSDLVETWRAARFVENTGDAILAVLPAESAPRLMDHFPRCLQEELADRASKPRARGPRLRLRVALHVGLLLDEYSVAPVCAAAIDVNRLLEAEPLRAALRDSDPDVTFAAFLVSAKLFDTYVAGGWTRLRASQFTKVRVKAEEYKGVAYLYVPTPSPGKTPSKTPSTPAGPGAAGRPAPVPGGPSMIGLGDLGNDDQIATDTIVERDLREERS
jgi:hypothetical protein